MKMLMFSDLSTSRQISTTHGFRKESGKQMQRIRCM